MKDLSDSLTKTVTYRRNDARPRRQRLVDVDSPEGARVLGDHVWIATWHAVEHLMVPQILKRAGFAMNGSGAIYHPTEEEDPALPPYLTVFSPLGEVNLSVQAYERFMLRFFRFIIADALKHEDPETKTSWWPGMTASVERIANRLDEETSSKGEK